MPKPKVTVLLTRPRADAESFAEAIRSIGFTGEILISPLLKIVRQSVQFDHAKYAGVIFTSRNAVLPAPYEEAIAWCVGEKTAEKANQMGWQVRIANGDVESLFQLILQNRPEGRLIHLRGVHTVGDLANRLSSVGIPADEEIVYSQEPKKLTVDAQNTLISNNPVVLPVFSPRTARTLKSQGPFIAPLTCVAISKAVSSELKDLSPQNLLVSKQQSAQGMLDATKVALMQLDAL